MVEGKNKFRGWCYITTYIISRFASIILGSFGILNYGEKIALCIIFIVAIVFMNYATWKRGVSKEYDYPYIKRRKNLYLTLVILISLSTMIAFINTINDIIYLRSEGYYISLYTLPFEAKASLLFWYFGNIYIFIVMLLNYNLSKKLQLTDEKQLNEINESNSEDKEASDLIEDVSGIQIENFSKIKTEEHEQTIKSEDLKKNEEVSEDNGTDSEVRYCRICGTKLKEDSIYCHKCGIKVRD